MRKKVFAAVLAMLMLTGCANTAGDKAEITMTETTSVSQTLPDEVEVEVCEEDNDDEFTDPLEDVIFEDDEEEYDPYPEDELLENGNEDISQFLEATASTSAPAKVKLKKAYTAKKTSVTISWSKIKNAKGYRVQIYNSSKKVWKNLKTITKNSTVSYKVTGLKAGTKYKLRVKAYTKASGKTAWGKASAAKNVVTKAKAVTLKATNITEKSVKFSWAKVKCHGYKLQQYTNKTWKTIRTLKNTAASATVSDLKSNTSYKYRIVSYVTDSSKNKTWNTNSSACSITTKPTTTKQTTTAKPTTTTKQTTKATTTTTAKPITTTTTTAWQHNHTEPVYKEVTKTYWMAGLQFYYGGHPEYCTWGPNRLTPDRDPDGYWQRRTSYDLLCWHYGRLEDVPDEYKIQWITKDNCTDYGISSSEWYNLTSYNGYSIATTDYWGNITEFNPEYDVLVGIKATASKKAINAYEDQFDVSFMAGCSNVGNCYMPVAQEKKTEVDYYRCSDCGKPL